MKYYLLKGLVNMYKKLLILNLITLISASFFVNAKNYVPDVESSLEVRAKKSENLGFNELSKQVKVFAMNKNEQIGQLLIFDQNKGFLLISNDNEVMVESFNKGLSTTFEAIPDKLFFDGRSIKTNENVSVWLKNNSQYGFGNGISDKFHRHTEINFFSSKTRYLLKDWDPMYHIPVNTDDTDFKGKRTWSSKQTIQNGCAAFALANLLWTYKINNIVDLTQDYVTSSELANFFHDTYLDPNSVYGTWAYNVDNINSWLTNGYYIDYVDVSNGISDNLENAPIIGDYISDFEGHFALVTGKGRSLFGIKIYTSLDIVNSWGNYDYEIADSDSSYPIWKYWVDNQYICFGWTLRDSNGDVVKLLEVAD